jgi:hypothetical protein
LILAIARIAPITAYWLRGSIPRGMKSPVIVIDLIK